MKQTVGRTVMPITGNYKQPALDLVEKVFTEYKDAKEGRMVRDLVEEIRAKKYYIPALEIIAVGENREIIGYAMFSRFHIENRYEDELLMLTPVAVKTEFQRQHISRDMIEYGLAKAKALGYKAVLVEGNPRNYNPRGFRTSSDYGIVPGENLHLPAIECLMVNELVPGTLGESMHGAVDYSFYRALQEE